MDKKIFTKRLKEILEKSGLPLREIAKRAELDLRTLKRYCNVDVIPTARMLIKLNYALSFEADYLLQIGKYRLP